MKITAFTKKYNDLKTSTAKINFIKEMIIENKKLSFLEKKNNAERIARISCTDQKTGAYKSDSIMVAYLFALTVVREYTKLEFTDNALNDYEELNACGSLTKIIDQVDEAERSELSMFVKLAVDDYKENHGDTISRFTGWIDQFVETMGSIVNNIPAENKEKIIQMIADNVKESR